MKIVKVTYTVQAEYAAQNARNIRLVIDALQKLQDAGIHYHVCMHAESNAFTHTAFFKTETDQQLLNQLPEFISFQQQLKASQPVSPPKQELLELVGSSKSIF